MSSQSGSLLQRPGGAPPPPPRGSCWGAPCSSRMWIALWSFFILAVAVPAAQVHRASASLAADAVAGGQASRVPTAVDEELSGPLT